MGLTELPDLLTPFAGTVCTNAAWSCEPAQMRAWTECAILLPRPFREEEKRPGYHCWRMRVVPIKTTRLGLLHIFGNEKIVDVFVK